MNGFRDAMQKQQLTLLFLLTAVADIEKVEQLFDSLPSS